MHVHKNWVIVVCENWSSESHSSLTGVNEFNICIFHVCCPVWMKFGIRDMTIMLLNIHEFHGIRCREGHTFLVGANEIHSRVQKFLAWHSKAAPDGKYCERYIVPSRVTSLQMWKVCWNKGRLCWKIAKLFYFCHLKKLVRPETFGPYHVTSTCIPTLFLASTLHPCCSTAFVHMVDSMATICACFCGHKIRQFLGPEGVNDWHVGTVDRCFTVQSLRIMYLQWWLHCLPRVCSLLLSYEVLAEANFLFDDAAVLGMTVVCFTI